MKLKYKIFITVVSMGLIVLFLGLVTFFHFDSLSVTKSELLKNEENVKYISETIENDLMDLVRLTETISSTDEIKDALVLSNDYYNSLSINDRETIITDLNDTWMSIDDENDPFIKERTDNNVALFLKAQEEKYPNLYGEIFLTNKYGVMISSTSKLTTLAHSQKYWWQGSFNNGEGIVYIDDRGYDNSVDGYVLGVVVPIYDDSDNIIGILKSNYNIAYIFENSVSKFHDLVNNGEYFIVRTKGLIVNGENIEPLSEEVSPILLNYLDERSTISQVININNEDQFVSIAPISITYDSDEIEFGGSSESIDHSEGNLGEGWSALFIIDKDIALNGLKAEFQSIMIVSLGFILLIGIGSLMVGELLSKPFKLLNEYIKDVGKGNLTKKDFKITNDEIGNLTQSFNNMLDNLNKTLISNKILEHERNLARMYLDVAGVMLLVLNTKGEITLINKKGCEILNASEEKLIGKNWFENFIPEDIRKDLKKRFDESFKTKSGFSTYYENRIIDALGNEKILSWHNIVLYDINNEIIGILSSGEDITEAIKAKEDLIKVGYEDVLTGLKNRRFYEEYLSSIDKQENYPLTIIMADINGLKLINDAFGHLFGDKALIEIANLLKEESFSDSIVARIGGDEFAIVSKNKTREEVLTIMNEIRIKAKQINIEGVSLSISLGLSIKTDSKMTINKMFTEAEDWMYREKLNQTPSNRSMIIDTIIATLNQKDKYSEIHSIKVSKLSRHIAELMDFDDNAIAEITTAGLLHDIGKIIIPTSILNKKGSLTDEEYAEIKKHPEIGFRILNSVPSMKNIAKIVLSHHERIDGKGYPSGLKGDDIPIESKVIGVADAIEAMLNDRTYRKKLTKEECRNELIKFRGKQFCKDVVDIVLSDFDEIYDIATSLVV